MGGERTEGKGREGKRNETKPPLYAADEPIACGSGAGYEGG